MYQPHTPQPSYAPATPSGGYTPSLASTIPPDTEVKPTTTTQERDLLDSLAELYSILRTLDGLERAYQMDALPDPEYTEMCNKMIKQYQSILSDKSVEREFGDLGRFMEEWNVACPRAAETLRAGLPRTSVFAGGQGFGGQGGQGGYGGQFQGMGQGRTGQAVNQPSGSLILAATENFITFLDALKLNYVSKSTLHPLLSEVIQSVNKVTDKDFEHRGKIIQWLITLNQMRTSEELSEEQAGDLAFDMEQAYGGFKSIIS